MKYKERIGKAIKLINKHLGILDKFFLDGTISNVDSVLVADMQEQSLKEIKKILEDK